MYQTPNHQQTPFTHQLQQRLVSNFLQQFSKKTSDEASKLKIREDGNLVLAIASNSLDLAILET